MTWFSAAIGAAFFTGITAILAKCGIKKTDSDIATALRTIVVALFAILMAAIAGSWHTLPTIDPRSLFFLIISGIATGASWLCYFKALSVGDVNKVVPIDKASTALTVVLAIAFLGEHSHLLLKIACSAALAIGAFLMVDKSSKSAPLSPENPSFSWLPYALGAAFFAALTAILSKIGIENVESNLGTAIRTCVILVMAWLVVGLKGKYGQLQNLDRKEVTFIGLSGIATGAAWLCYYYAIQNGPVSIVVPIDKLSILISIAFSALVFREKLTWRAALGLAMIVSATVVLAIAN
ncbi:MAG: EamA family transporter [Actinomycetaceae bacterium]|nr:EamA family transporter [Actinomycetaceae bacterium]